MSFFFFFNLQDQAECLACNRCSIKACGINEKIYEDWLFKPWKNPDSSLSITEPNIYSLFNLLACLELERTFVNKKNPIPIPVAAGLHKLT